MKWQVLISYHGGPYRVQYTFPTYRDAAKIVAASKMMGTTGRFRVRLAI